MRKKCSNEEEEKEDVRVLGLPSYLQVLQKSRRDEKEKLVIAS